jgi:hypothetical protein
VSAPGGPHPSPSDLRTASRTASRARGLDRRPIWDCLPFLAEDVGRLVNAVRRDDLAAVRAEVAACAALLDHIAERYDGAELAALVGDQVAAAGRPLPAPASSAW